MDPEDLLPNPQLPTSQLESLKFKANQIIDSIQALQRTIEAGNQPVMPSWPEILSKYNILLSQTHSFSVALAGNPALNAALNRQGLAMGGTNNIFEKIVLHPNVPMSDAQLDSEVIPLIRNQQTLDVLRAENETVRRMAEHMTTKGSLGVLNTGGLQSRDTTTAGYGPGVGTSSQRGRVDYDDVLRECDEIRSAHDRRVERAVRAVTMLRDKFDWKQRLRVEVEEPEELEWDPRMRASQEAMDDIQSGAEDGQMESNGEGEDGDVGMDSPEGGSSDEDEVEGALVNAAMDIHSPLSDAQSFLVKDGAMGFSAATSFVTDSTTESSATNFLSGMGL